MTQLTILSKDIRIQDGLYSLNDLHKASGAKSKHRPNYFLSNQQTIELIEVIEQSRNSGFAVKTKHGGTNKGTWVCKELVYSYAMWISAKFHLYVIRAFDAMVSKEHSDNPISDDQFRSLSKIIEGKAKLMPDDQRRSVQFRLWRQVHRAFNVASGHELTEAQLPEARNFIAAYVIEGEYLPKQDDLLGKDTVVVFAPEEKHFLKYKSEELYGENAWQSSISQLFAQLNEAERTGRSCVIQNVRGAWNEVMAMRHRLERATNRLQK